LVFDRYDYGTYDNARTNTHEVVIPSIELTPDVDRRNIQVGDRKEIRILTGYDWLTLQYVGLVQGITIDATGSNFDVKVEISEKYIKSYNVLDTILTNLKDEVRKK
jgi:hypothetical protein